MQTKHTHTHHSQVVKQEDLARVLAKALSLVGVIDLRHLQLPDELAVRQHQREVLCNGGRERKKNLLNIRIATVDEEYITNTELARMTPDEPPHHR